MSKVKLFKKLIDTVSENVLGKSPKKPTADLPETKLEKAMNKPPKKTTYPHASETNWDNLRYSKENPMDVETYTKISKKYGNKQGELPAVAKTEDIATAAYKIGELKSKISFLEKHLKNNSLPSGRRNRMQKELEFTKKRLKVLGNSLEKIKRQHPDLVEEFKDFYEKSGIGKSVFD